MQHSKDPIFFLALILSFVASYFVSISIFFCVIYERFKFFILINEGSTADGSAVVVFVPNYLTYIVLYFS